MERIALVDSDAAVLDSLRMLFEAHERVVFDYPTPAAFLEPPGPPEVDALVVDAGLPEMSGLRMLERWASRPAGLRVVLLSLIVDAELMARSTALGVTRVLPKPTTQQALFDALGLL